jgi:hypothetical protein
MMENLVDTAAIAAAQTKLDSVKARRGPAAERFFASQRAVAVAGVAHNDALSGDSGADPFVTAEALENARKAMDVAIQSEAAIEAAIVRAQEQYNFEVGLAHQAMHDAAVAKLISVTGAYDAIVARQSELLAEFRAAVDQHTAAMANGAHGQRSDMLTTSSPSRTLPSGVWTMPSRDETLRRLAGPHGRWAGLNSDGTPKQETK